MSSAGSAPLSPFALLVLWTAVVLACPPSDQGVPRIGAADGRRTCLQAGFQAGVQEFCHQEDRKARSKEASGKEGGNGEEASGGEEGGEEEASGEEGGGQPEPNEEGDEEAAFVFVQPRQEDALRA